MDSLIGKVFVKQAARFETWVYLEESSRRSIEESTQFQDFKKHLTG